MDEYGVRLKTPGINDMLLDQVFLSGGFGEIGTRKRFFLEKTIND